MKIMTHKLKQLREIIQSINLQDLFVTDPNRAKIYSLEVAGIFLDYSKNFITDEIKKHLLQLADEANLQQKIHDLFSEKLVNFTEKRPALHTQLRQPLNQAKTEIAATRQKIRKFCHAVHTHEILGFSGKAFTDVINIGIGGSDLGAKLACEALKSYQNNTLNFHFISNIDDYPLNQLLKKLNPETTLVIVVSKSFTTIETLLNMQTVKQWFCKTTNTNDAWLDHFIAVTANGDKAKKADFKEDFIFPFWDGVGGRYSLWSAAGLSIALCIGANNFEKLLAGAHAMDLHFKEASFCENMPVILALLEILYTNGCDAQTQATIPYCAQLNFLPNYLQQLVMESNGKNVNRTGETLSYNTSPIIWGEAGTNCQHSFMQLLHQSERLIPVDFIAVLQTQTEGSIEHHQHVLANCFSQAHVLMIGKDINTAEAELLQTGASAEQAKELALHKVLPGNHPSNMLVLRKLTPEILGALIALYEHKVFVSAAIWNINPFDQWGVEMGKQVAVTMLSTIQKNELCLHHNNNKYDSSTEQLIMLYRDNK